ncbi:unnamed protein product, partial [Ectocarpus sp. 13 AM-2016]
GSTTTSTTRSSRPTCSAALLAEALPGRRKIQQQWRRRERRPETHVPWKRPGIGSMLFGQGARLPMNLCSPPLPRVCATMSNHCRAKRHLLPEKSARAYAKR